MEMYLALCEQPVASDCGTVTSAAPTQFKYQNTQVSE